MTLLVGRKSLVHLWTTPISSCLNSHEWTPRESRSRWFWLLMLFTYAFHPQISSSHWLKDVLPPQACGEALEPPLPSVEGRALLRLTLQGAAGWEPTIFLEVDDRTSNYILHKWHQDHKTWIYDDLWSGWHVKTKSEPSPASKANWPSIQKFAWTSRDPPSKRSQQTEWYIPSVYDVCWTILQSKHLPIITHIIIIIWVDFCLYQQNHIPNSIVI